MDEQSSIIAMYYETSCFVPDCNSKKTLNTKFFVNLPTDEEERKKWMLAAGRDSVDGSKYKLCCVDHFDLKNDVLSWARNRPNAEDQIILKKGVVPHIFNSKKKVVDHKIDSYESTEVGKFKRRLIRSVARLMLVEKKSKEEIWATLQTESGCSELLWNRMRALTLKKLKRLLAAHDCVSAVPTMARMSLTDWLLFDLVLVHEDIDVIEWSNSDSKVLTELFTLVQRYKIEDLRGDQLAEAWTAATLHYNAQGHQCSPMLLQLRWYQMKKTTRQRFYDFWYNFRGNMRLLDKIKSFIPTPLQNGIAKRYHYIITQPFEDWEYKIQNRFIIMPDEFELKMSKKNLPKPCDENNPDIILIEPVVETIDLGVDSDTDEVQMNKDIASTVTLNSVKVEQEPIISENADDLTQNNNDDAHDDIAEIISDINYVETSNIDKEVVLESDTDNTKEHFLEIPNEETVIESIPPDQVAENILMPLITNVYGNVIDSNELPIPAVEKNVEFNKNEINTTEEINDDCKITEDIPVISIDDQESHNKMSSEEVSVFVENTSNESNAEHVMINASVVTFEQNAANKNKTEELSINASVPISKSLNQESQIEQVKRNEFENSESIELEDDIIKIESKLNEYVPTDFTFADDGIKLVDDGIELVKDKTKKTSTIVNPDEINTLISDSDESSEAVEVAPKFDLKLLMNPIVCTIKLDAMHSVKDDFSSVKGNDIIAALLTESKPIKNEVINVTNDEQQKRDLSGLRVKCEEESQCSDSSIKCDDDLFYNHDSDSCDDAPEFLKVPINDNILQKPRWLSYNPIQLCKNPDFNTRLKRLNVGFFSYSQNIALLKKCIPLTIDLHKAFEDKLVDGVMYLKCDNLNGQIRNLDVDNNDVQTKCASTVLPSAMPVQSLIDNAPQDVIKPQDLRAYVSPQPLTDSLNVSKPIQSTTLVGPIERKKVNLPDIQEIRRINQQLLIAEVTPIIQNNDSKIPIQLVRQANIDRPFQSSLTNTDEDTTVFKSNLNFNVSQSDNNTIKATTPMLNKQVNEHLITPVLPTTSVKNDIIIPPVGTNEETNPNLNINTQEKDDPQLTRPAPKSKRTIRRKPGEVLSWLSTPIKPAVDDSLITIDTLNKMFHVVDGNDFTLPKIVTKKLREIKKPVTLKCVHIKSKKDKNDEEVIETIKKSTVKPKVKLVSTENSTKKYCCWARQKIDKDIAKVKFIRQHRCPVGSCLCCCRSILESRLNENITRSVEIRKEESNVTITSQIIPTPIDVDKCVSQNHTPCDSIITEVDCSVGDSSAGDSSTGDSSAVDSAAVDSSRETNNFDHEKPLNEAVMTEVDFSVTETVNFDNSYGTKTTCEHVTHVTNEMRSSVSVLLNESAIDVECEDNSNKITASSATHFKLPRKTQIYAQTPKRRKYVITVDTGKYDIQTKPDRRLMTKSIQCEIEPQESIEPYRSIQSHRSLENYPHLVIESKEREIIVDGSSTRRIIPKSKMVYLNSKNISKEPTDSPIFLGKDTIILTTVKFTNNFTSDIQNSDISQDKPQLLLPKGVQIVMMPNGELTLVVEPGIELKPDELAVLPRILAAVVKQLSINNPTVNEYSATEIISKISQCSIPNDDAKITDVITESTPPSNTVTTVDLFHDYLSNVTKSTVLNDNITVVTEASPNENINDISTDSKDLESDTRQKTPEKNQSVELNESKESNENTVGPVIKAPLNSLQSNSDGKSSTIVENRKSLLSDLMEMSGISADDTVPVTQEMSENLTPKPNEPDLIVTSDNPTNIQELYPVTSYSELKYACDHNGRFFKLDFNTGVIVPINVCVKTPRKRKLGTDPNLGSAIIDLTEDDDRNVTIQEEMTTSSMNVKQIMTSHNYESLKQQSYKSIVKPVKLFTAPIILKRRNLVTSHSSNFSSYRHKRKQELKTVEAEINFIDSDTPMEEEYLEDYLEEHSEGSDSDNEPLANKAKRMRTEGEYQGVIKESLKDGHDENREDSNDSGAENSRKSVRNEKEGLVDDKGNISFFDTDIEDSLDDCILGV